ATVATVVVRNVDSSLFVDGALGRDTNVGTRQAPLASLDEAFARAQVGGKRDIYVASTGSAYAMSRPLPSHGSLYGGFEGKWIRNSVLQPTRIAVPSSGLTWAKPVTAADVELSGLRIEASATGNATGVFTDFSAGGTLTIYNTAVLANATGAS